MASGTPSRFVRSCMRLVNLKEDTSSSMVAEVPEVKVGVKVAVAEVCPSGGGDGSDWSWTLVPKAFVGSVLKRVFDFGGVKRRLDSARWQARAAAAAQAMISWYSGSRVMTTRASVCARRQTTCSASAAFSSSSSVTCSRHGSTAQNSVRYWSELQMLQKPRVNL